MGDESELKDLAEGLLSKQRGAWDRLYSLTHLPILRMLRRALGDHGKAEDALQATFVTAIERVSSFNPGRSTPDAWIWGIARHKAQEVARSRRPRPVSVDSVDPASPAEGSAVGIDGELVSLALDQLEPRYAEVLRRKYIQGESLEEIAAGLHLKAATIGTLLHRGRERFKGAYERLRSKENAR